VEVYKHTDNTSAARSAAFIALYPISNAAGFCNFWKLESNRNIFRKRYVELATTEEIFKRVNNIAEEESQKVSNKSSLILKTTL
jgi:hypothetical protein